MDCPITPYRRKAYLDPDGTFEVTLRWYPAPRGAAYFPGYHRFASADWNDQDPHRLWYPPGEIKDEPRRFYAGLGPQPTYLAAQPPGSPPLFVGRPEWYESGVPLDVIHAALANPPGPPPWLNRGPAATPGMAWLGTFGDLYCGNPGCPTRRHTSTGGWQWGGRTRCVGTPKVTGRGGWKWGGSTAWCRRRTLAAGRGGWKWGGSTAWCRRRTLAAGRGGWKWGGSTARNPYPPAYADMGGWKWGGFTAWCRPRTLAADLGGWEWGGFTTWGLNVIPAYADLGGWEWGGSTDSTFTHGPCEGPPVDCCCQLAANGCPTLFAEFYDCTGSAAVYNGIVVALTSPDSCSRIPIVYTGSMGPVGGCPGFTFVFTCDPTVSPCVISIALTAGASCGYDGSIADPNTCTPVMLWDFGTLTVTAPMCCPGTVKLRVHS